VKGSPRDSLMKGKRWISLRIGDQRRQGGVLGLDILTCGGGCVRILSTDPSASSKKKGGGRESRSGKSGVKHFETQGGILFNGGELSAKGLRPAEAGEDSPKKRVEEKRRNGRSLRRAHSNSAHLKYIRRGPGGFLGEDWWGDSIR